MGRVIQAAYEGIQLLDIPGISAVNKFGRCDNVDSTVATDIWDGANGESTVIHVPPTAARIHGIGSGDAADTAAGAGAQAVEVTGLDENWALVSEEVELAGVADVNTINTFIRIFRMQVTRVGANGVATANILANAAVDATITAVIETPNNQTLMAVYTVPAGCRAFVTSYYASVNRQTAANAVVDIRLMAKPAADVATSPWQLKHIQGLFQAGVGLVRHEFNPYVEFAEKTDLKIQATDCNTNDTDISAGFDIILKNG
jgi:hypothetical protein